MMKATDKPPPENTVVPITNQVGTRTAANH